MLIAVTGYKNSGKNAVCNVLAETEGFEITGFADALKEQMLAIDPWVPVTFTGFTQLSDLVRMYGWDECKERFPDVRRLLQRAGTEGGRKIFGQQIWVDTWYKRTKVLLEQEFDVCVSDTRFLNEAAAVRELGGQVWRVHRQGCVAGEHASESELDKIMPDQVIYNDGTLDDLTDHVSLTLARVEML